MMQPYLFPYLGYFQLMAAVDIFVLGDDLQYVKESWINRNRILVNGKDKLVTFPLKKDSHHLNINQRYFSDNFIQEMEHLLRIIFSSYRKAPCFESVYPLLEDILMYDEKNLAKFTIRSLRRLCDYMRIETPILVASDLVIGEVADKQERVILTQKKLGGDVYINLIGGMKLYSPERFLEHGIVLKFHQIDDICYSQFGNEFVPLLSIIDVLMFNDLRKMQNLLSRYSLLDHMGQPA
ncbi:WbqC family protein [Noviherbaspirillum sp. Root189]|uniref:WbqC family protein n=1 Tax=Noviherbaspirillum sp. Root189 TaxID=1736487 RepID=UPI0019104C51|nr:WbqC family protein [Noviherbaspirillum sp. Root189]